MTVKKRISRGQKESVETFKYNESKIGTRAHGASRLNVSEYIERNRTEKKSLSSSKRFDAQQIWVFSPHSGGAQVCI